MRRSANQGVNILQEATSRDFSGGLDVSDSELNLSSKYARVLDNVIVGIDGSLEVRQGNALFSDTSSASDAPISNFQFFYRYLIAVTNRGEVIAIDGNGVATAIWNDAIAAALRPGLTIWSNADLVVFGEFNGELIIMNGHDKPLLVTTSLAVDYLADKGSGSNINVPIGQVCAGFSNHFFIADNFMLHVSERNASGTWLGDVGTVYVNSFDMRPYVAIGDTEILGLFPFKGFLLVSFREIIVPITVVEDQAATPALNIQVAGDSVINNYGSVSPRVGQDIGDMELITDIAGVASLNLSNFTRILGPDRPSRFVDPLLQPLISGLDLETLRLSAFSMYDRKLSAYTLFLPDNVPQYQTATTGFQYRYISGLSIKAWSRIRGGNWKAATRSSSGDMFLLRHNSTKIFLQGDSKLRPRHADYVGEQEGFSDGTFFTDHTGFNPVADVSNSGVPINWVWELPWTDLKHRGMTKTLRYIILDTEGDGEFTCEVFVDDLYSAAVTGEPFSDSTLFSDGTGFVPYAELPLSPALTMEYIAKDAGGYGVQSYGPSPYGGGNNTALRTLTLMPTKFNTMKLRFSGSTTLPVKFVAITLLYQVGSVRRLPNG